MEEVCTMSARILTAAAMILALTITANPAEAFPWPSRWTNRNRSTPPAPNSNAPAPATSANPAAPPVAAWPPRARDILPEATLPKLPSPSGLSGPSSKLPPFTPSAGVVKNESNFKLPPMVPRTAPDRSAPMTGTPLVELGRPVALPMTTPPSEIATLPPVSPPPQMTNNPMPMPPSSAPPMPYLPPGAGPVQATELVQQVSFDRPRTVVRAQMEDPAILPVQLSGPPPVPPPPGGSGVVNPLPPLPEGRYNAGVEMSQPLGRPTTSPLGEFYGFGTPTGAVSNPDGSWCFTDHAFDEGLISPVTSPFNFEDPRAITEVRPLFIYSLVPNSSPLNGGSTTFFGVQGRLAFGPSFSLVMNKLGGIWFSPEDPNAAGVDGGSGFAEINIGPKWTFWRSESLNMVAATGMNFQIPLGSGSAYQNTGLLGLDPYISYGWNFGRSSYGSFNFMTSVGYNFSIDGERSQYFHNHYHLSYDVMNLHKIYPLLEVNWYKYTHMGDNTPYTFEGKDLINFGAANAGFHSYLSIAGGARFKLNEHIQTGFACEWDLLNQQNDLEKFRLTVDLIFRY
jgi:hypothetical protein